ncbi:MAG: ribonuclease P protein component [Polaribacter sp.]|uniref:ribonuclease P protein component n=1 Tax=Polaribacter sp. TaxID=1920175 RepID=UPI00262526D2|nr:ribonuclease P protein component [uncultured Polaribacter sp.]
MKYTLGKQERLKRRKLIEKLYSEGKSVKSFPLRMMYLQTQHTSDFPCQVGVSVPKRNFKLAVSRNRIKRLLRESYRLQKEIVYNNLEEPYVFMISYIGKEEPVYEEVFLKMQKLLNLFVEKTKEIKNEEITS